MALVDWSISIIGYPKHERSGVPMVGVSHMTTYEALRFAESIGQFTGWLLVDGMPGQIDDAPLYTPHWSVLAELFVDERVNETQGVMSGSVTFVSAVRADGEPAEGIELGVWAQKQGRLWLEVHDNELCYWGGLNDEQIDALLAYVCARYPVPYSEEVTVLTEHDAAQLRTGLFQHGWQRNGALVREGGRYPVVQLWGGVHSDCVLDHGQKQLPSEVNVGWSLTCKKGHWTTKSLNVVCPLDDERARTFGRNT